MSHEKEKFVADSFTTQVQIVLPQHANAYKRLFGGVLLQWVDIIGAVVARRHSEKEVTTAFIDSVQFEKPAFIGSTVILEGYITYVGTTSMEVRIDSFVENLNGTRERISCAYLIMVAIDDKGTPTKVPRLKLLTKEDKENWEIGEARKQKPKAGCSPKN